MYAAKARSSVAYVEPPTVRLHFALSEAVHDRLMLQTIVDVPVRLQRKPSGQPACDD